MADFYIGLSSEVTLPTKLPPLNELIKEHAIPLSSTKENLGNYHDR